MLNLKNGINKLNYMLFTISCWSEAVY